MGSLSVWDQLIWAWIMGAQPISYKSISNNPSLFFTPALKIIKVIYVNDLKNQILLKWNSKVEK